MASSAGSSLKSWYTMASKAACEQYYWAKKTLTGKAVTIPNDSLEELRVQLDSLGRFSEAAKQDLTSFTTVLSSLSTKETSALALATTAGSLPTSDCSRELLRAVEGYSASYIAAATNVRDALEAVTQLIQTINDRLTLIAQIQKKMDARETLYVHVMEEEKKWQKAREGGDPKVMERKQKAELATERYDNATFECREMAQNALIDKDFFQATVFNRLVQLQSRVFQMLKETLGRHYATEAVPTLATAAAPTLNFFTRGKSHNDLKPAANERLASRNSLSEFSSRSGTNTQPSERNVTRTPSSFEVHPFACADTIASNSPLNPFDAHDIHLS